MSQISPILRRLKHTLVWFVIRWIFAFWQTPANFYRGSSPGAQTARPKDISLDSWCIVSALLLLNRNLLIESGMLSEDVNGQYSSCEKRISKFQLGWTLKSDLKLARWHDLPNVCRCGIALISPCLVPRCLTTSLYLHPRTRHCKGSSRSVNLHIHQSSEEKRKAALQELGVLWNVPGHSLTSHSA